jgi:hypothetical protein
MPAVAPVSKSSRRPYARRVSRDVERLRAAAMEQVPSWYSPWAHLAGTSGIALAVAALSLFELRDPSSVELLTVPITFLLANAVEWRAHKSLLHRRTPPLHKLYDLHTPVHHAIYQTADLAVRTTREWKLVLLPGIGVVSIVLLAVPFSCAAGRLVGANVGWLVLFTSGLYVWFYELAHLSYHLPPQSFVGRLPPVRALRGHHARHHDPALMAHYNFNVTIPLYDWIRGTIAPLEARGPAED